MRNINHVIWAEVLESLRARWFYIFCLVFGGMIIVLIASGITGSRVLGFSGLSRLLITYLQLCIALIPIFVLISTVRSVVGERESNVLEYFLSMPISIPAYYWGKLIGKCLVISFPVVVSLLGAAFYGLFKGLVIPWATVSFFALLLGTLSLCFVGVGMFISTIVRKQEWGLGLAFLVWLVLLVFIDVIMIALMLRQRISEKIIVLISLLNPLQAFRTGGIILFDPALSSIGPASYVILDTLGKTGFLMYTILYPLGLGLLFSWAGYLFFKKGDLI